jgi:hypothetical protein
MVRAVCRATEEGAAAIETVQEVQLLSWKNQMKELVAESINFQSNILGITKLRLILSVWDN